MQKINVVPNTILLTSLRDVGYTETMAICDIVDNSIDAGAKNIDIVITQKNNKVQSISIADDGIGMNKNTLIQALTLGSNVVRNQNALGHYGMGLKTAGLALAKEITVLTKESNKTGGFLGTFDLDFMLSSNTFGINIDKHPKPKLGTTITLNKVDKLTSTTAKTYIKSLSEELSLVFTKIIGKVNITVNGKNIIAHDVFLEGSSKNYNVDANGVTESPYNITFQVNGNLIKKQVKIDLWKMPLSASPELPYSQKAQGFYIFRNGRLIASHLDLDIYNKIPDLNNFRGAIYFDNMDDIKDAIGLNFSKQGVNFNEALVKELKWKLGPAIKRLREDIQSERALLSIKNNTIEDTLSKWCSKLFKRGINWSLGIYNGTSGAIPTDANYKPPKPLRRKVVAGKTTVKTVKQVQTKNQVKTTKPKKPPKPNTNNNNTFASHNTSPPCSIKKFRIYN